MRILHVILSDGFAGSERATAEACNEQSRIGHQVMLAVRRSHRGAGGASILDHIDASVAVVKVPTLFGTKRALSRAIGDFQPDVIHTHLRRSTRLVAKLSPAAATIATLHLTWNGRHFAGMDGVICIADWQRAEIPANYQGTVFRIEESHVPNRRLSPAEREALRTELGVGPEDYLIGGVGRLARSKGFDVLIDAFKRASLPQARLVILGDGRERRRLEKRLPPNATLAGFRANVKDYYQAFDVFVSPSRSEPLGRVLLEAFDAGVPVIATRTQGPAELVKQHGGTLVPLEDPRELARVLREHNEARPKREPADLSAHHIDRVMRETLAAYEALIASRRK